jgi:predicted kinase
VLSARVRARSELVVISPASVAGFTSGSRAEPNESLLACPFTAYDRDIVDYQEATPVGAEGHDLADRNVAVFSRESLSEAKFRRVQHKVERRSLAIAVSGACQQVARGTCSLQVQGRAMQNAVMNRPRLYLICGLPGAGKTTRSRQISNSVPAVQLCADEWVIGLGLSLVDYDFRIRLQQCLLSHAAALLRCNVSVVVEFGSWHRQEREAIREVAARENATAELHFVNAPLDELVRRVRARGGPECEALVTGVLLKDSAKFEEPSPAEISLFDRYVGPNDDWRPPAT